MKKAKKKKKQVIDHQLQLYEDYAKSQQVFQKYRGNYFTAKQMQRYKMQYKNQQLIVRNIISLPSMVLVLLELSSDHLIILIYVGLIQLMIRKVDLEITRSSCNIC